MEARYRQALISLRTKMYLTNIIIDPTPLKIQFHETSNPNTTDSEYQHWEGRHAKGLNQSLPEQIQVMIEVGLEIKNIPNY